MRVIHTCATKRLADEWAAEHKRRNRGAKTAVRKEKLPKNFSSYKYGYVVYEK
jgi:hypothetical protein